MGEPVDRSKNPFGESVAPPRWGFGSMGFWIHGRINERAIRATGNNRWRAGC